MRTPNFVRPLTDAERTWAAPLFAGLDRHLAVPAVLAGQASGEAYVDSAPSPRSGLLLTGHRAYLAGDPGNRAFLATVRSVLERRFVSAGWEVGVFTLYYDHPDWPAAIEAALSPGLKDIRALHQCYFLKDQRAEADTPSAEVPNGFRLAAADVSLVDDPARENKEALLEEMCSERASVTDFLARSFGLALLCENAVAGWCLSEYNLGRRCEVGIAVDEPFRRRGLATLLGHAFARQALAAGVTEIGWHCRRDNVASCATARGLGFSLVREYSSHWVALSRAPTPS